MKNSKERPHQVCQVFQPARANSELKKFFRALRLFAMTVLACGALVSLSSCGSSGGESVTIQITPGSASIDQGQPVTFTANLANDLRNEGVTWSLSGSSCAGLTGAGTSGCGNLSSVTTTSVVFTAPAGLSGSLSVTLTATAVANTSATRTATITVELPLTFTTTTPLPSGSNGVPYSQAITVTGGVAPLKFALASGSGALPPGLQLNQSGTITGRPSGPVSGQANPSVFTVQATDDSTIPVSATQQYSIFVSPAPTLTVTALSPLASGFVNFPYSTSISTSGGVTPFTWSLVSGNLPPGLSFNTATGQITGVPGALTPNTQQASFSFTVQVTDSTLPTSQVATSQQLAIVIQKPQPLSVTPSSLPAGSTAAAYSASLTATGGIPPYTWKLISGQLPQGLTFSPGSGAIAGTPILAGISDFTVQVTDSEVTPATLSTPYSISVAAGTNSNSLINGQYSFLFNGFDSDGSVTMGGSVTADGTGTITAGGMDINRVSGVTGSVATTTGGIAVPRATVTGTYSLGTDGRGTMELVATSSLGVPLTLDFNLVLDSAGNIHFFEDNSTTTNTDVKRTHGNGIMRPTSGAFGAGSFDGNYAFVFSGANSAGARTALGGVVHADGIGNIGTGGGGANADYNEGGTFSSQIQVTGLFTFDTGTHGVASFTFELPGKSAYTLDYSMEFVTAQDIFFVGVDAADATHPRLSGEVVLQSPNSPFNSSSFSVPSVATGNGVSSSNASVLAGLLTPVPSTTPNCSLQVANCVTLNYDENAAGAITSPSPSLIGNFQIAANGRAAFTFNSVSNGQLTAVSSPRVAAAYLTGPGTGFTIGADSGVTTGLLEQQESGVAFAASSFEDQYSVSAAFATENQVENAIGQLFADGASNITGTIDAIVPPASNSLTSAVTHYLDQPLVASYANISATGRGTMTTNGPTGFPTNLAFYIVSPGSVRAISVDNNNQHPEVLFFDH